MKSIVSLVAALAVGIGSASLTAQDREFLAAMERAQKERPKTLSSSARIAPESEPGDPLVVHGRAVEEDGKTPVGNAIIFAYHTNRPDSIAQTLTTVGSLSFRCHSLGFV